MISTFNNKWQVVHQKPSPYSLNMRAKLFIWNISKLHKLNNTYNHSILNLVTNYLSVFLNTGCLGYSTTNSIKTTSPVSYYGVPHKFKKYSEIKMVEPNDNWFKLLLELNSNIFPINQKVAGSQRDYFLTQAAAGVSVVNIVKFKKVWLSAYNLIYSVYYFNTKIVYFGTPVFKTETLALNFNHFNNLTHLWRYVRCFFFLIPLQLDYYFDFALNHLKLKGFHTAFILDTSFHRRSISFLVRNRFYTVGLISSRSDRRIVGFAIPLGGDSVFFQLFFVRLLFSLKRSSHDSKFWSKINSWNKCLL